ncbi:MAG: aminopeptidase P family N-terminal domain-containing protein, partial [Deinococcota bacterium]|nr:aminopeptidase P family N-terminal domain-containing protein [Deinococcota bacterium]
MTLLADQSELGIKLGRLAALMEARGVEALRITQGGNLAWLSGGGDFLVSQTGAPVAEMLLYNGKLTLITNAIEASRLEQEELFGGVEVQAFDWFDEGEKERLTASIVGEARTMDDGELDLYPARVPLLEVERARFRGLGKLASTTLTDALTGLVPGLSEKEVAARVKAAVEARGMACPVLLVAGQERLGKYRHPIPKGEPFGAIG